MLPQREKYALRALTAAAFLALLLPARPVLADATTPRPAAEIDHDHHGHEGGSHAGHAHEADHREHDHGHAHDHGPEHGHDDQEPGTGGGKDHDHSAHRGHDHDEKEAETEGHDGHRHEDSHAVTFSAEVAREFGISLQRAGPGIIAKSISRPAEVTYDLDRYTHVVPRVGGIVRSVNASQGDTVAAGAALAEIESRDLAELKAAFLAGSERFDLANQDFVRIRALRKKGIASEKSYLTSRSAFVEARIAMRSARQKLSSIGLTGAALGSLTGRPDANLTRYFMRAPMSGLVVSRHLVKGELVTDERDAFVIADLSSVWIDIGIYGSDLPHVGPGQRVTLVTETDRKAEGTISFLSPHVSRATRTATARVVLAGLSDVFRPGMFITALIAVSQHDVPVRVPNTALQVHAEGDVVFTKEQGGFRPRPVKIGRRNAEFSEIVAGLKEGESYVADGSFVIKAHLSKAAFGDGHNH